MGLTHSLIVVAILGCVVWWGRRIPLSGAHKRLAIGCRVVAIGALCAALWGPPYRRTHALPRYLIYLVDGSASIGAAQQDWMARRIASLESLRPRALERAIITFGADAQMVMPFGGEPLTDPDAIRHLLAGSHITRNQTNLEAGLLSTFALLPPDHRGGVILLSDGRETSGNVTSLLAYTRRLGLEVFPVAPPILGEAKTVWEELAVSPVVQRGSPVGIQLVVANGSSRAKRGQVTVALEGVPIKRQRMTVRPGWHVFTLGVPAVRRGTMALEVSLSVPEDGLTEHREAYIEVEGPPQVLLVGDRATALPALAMALKRREMEVAVARPTDLPAAPPTPVVDERADEPAAGVVNRLLDYDAVMLFNLPKSALSPRQVEVLRTYIEGFGGGLVMVGLGGDLAHEISTPVPLDALLPVQFEPKGLQETKRRVCIVMLIDRSASMIGPRIAATKRAAVELVKQLSAEDLVGILAFDTKPYVIAEVQQVGQLGPRLVEKLVTLRSSGGTDVYPALTAASDRLELTGSTLKHIILLSDGNTPFHAEAYRALVESFKLRGTTVSTIGIGSVFVNTDYLQWLARSTGGTFYEMRNLDELPRLIARDTQQAMGRLPFAEGYFRPSISPTTDWSAQTTDWPPLRGYFTTTAKPNARVDLTVNGGAGEDPLFARWTLGAGRVVSFTSDADLRWSPEWIRWAGFEGTWAQVVRWAMRPRMTEELFAWVDESRGTPDLVLEGALHDPRAKLITTDGSTGLPVSLIQTGTWRWHASLEQVPSGWYQLILESREGSSPIFVKRWVQVGTPPASGEAVGQPPREMLLRQIARATAGSYDMPDQALLPLTTRATTTEPLLTWWLPVAIIALLIDIALRGSSML